MKVEIIKNFSKENPSRLQTHNVNDIPNWALVECTKAFHRGGLILEKLTDTSPIFQIQIGRGFVGPHGCILIVFLTEGLCFVDWSKCKGWYACFPDSSGKFNVDPDFLQ